MQMLMRRTLLALAAFALTASGARAQTPVARLPVFDVVSVRLNNTGSRSISIDVEKNSFTATNVTLMNLTSEAYQVKPDMIAGGAAWMNSVRYDVQAKVLDGEGVDLEAFTDKQRGPMLQSVLAERFQLKLHEELKTLPLYELVVAKGGSKLKGAAAPNGADAVPRDGSFTIGRGALSAHAMPMSSLAAQLSEVVHRKVVDKTGLGGSFDFELKWTLEEDANGGKEAAAPADAPPPVFTALQEQLGLRLQSGKGPVETLVIDHVEKPSENE